MKKEGSEDDEQQEVPTQNQAEETIFFKRLGFGWLVDPRIIPRIFPLGNDTTQDIPLIFPFDEKE